MPTAGKRPTYWNGLRYVVPEDSTTPAPAGVVDQRGTQDEADERVDRDRQQGGEEQAADPTLADPQQRTWQHAPSRAKRRPGRRDEAPAHNGSERLVAHDVSFPLIAINAFTEWIYLPAYVALVVAFAVLRKVPVP